MGEGQEDRKKGKLIRPGEENTKYTAGGIEEKVKEFFHSSITHSEEFKGYAGY